MEETGLSWSPIYSGLIGGLVVAAMVFLKNNKSKTEGDIHHLEFGLLFKGFSIAIIPFTVFVLYAITQSYEGQEIAASLVGLGFVAGAIFFPYQAFFVKFSYDNDHIYFKSPIAGDNKASWKDVEKVGYSWLLQADYIIVAGIGRIWCSNMLNGYGELMEFIGRKKK
ncbi:hypothetical protein [Ferrimonas gelatinilytica]|uniref:Uncharacterized protein n=1 Tax=Ferrimonas gelatinilytica TaxID=1255257 RepID=A0ABP9S2T5_9GAMM